MAYAVNGAPTDGFYLEIISEKYSTKDELNKVKESIGNASELIVTNLKNGYVTINSTGTYATYGELTTRVLTSVVKGKYHIKLKDGYAIRGIAAWNGGQSEGVINEGFSIQIGENLVSTGTEQEYVNDSEYDYSVLTFCKTDASSNISPSEDMIEMFETLPSGIINEIDKVIKRVEKLEIRSINNAVFMGDSITHGVYSYFENNIKDDEHRYNGFDIVDMSSVKEASDSINIPYYFAKLANCKMVNLAKRGSGYVADSRGIGNALAVVNSYDFSNADFVGLCFGVNDYIQGKDIGNLADKSEGTLIGNMVMVISKILADNPLCKVVVYSPYNTFGQVSKGGDYTANATYGTEANNYALGYNLNGKGTLQDYVDAEDEVCRYYGIQHVKLSESNVCNRFSLKFVMIDGLHPSKEAWSKLAAEIYGKSNFGV